jgi:hypothetical protein
VYEIKSKNILEPDRPHMTILRMRIARWIPTATNTPSEYGIRVAFPLQKWMQKSPSVLRYKHTACLVSSAENNNNMMGARNYEVVDASAIMCGIIK